MAQEVVIVGADGTEHVFPSGFDPKRAASIVRQSAEPSPAQTDAAPTMTGPMTFGSAVRSIPGRLKAGLMTALETAVPPVGLYRHPEMLPLVGAEAATLATGGAAAGLLPSAAAAALGGAGGSGLSSMIEAWKGSPNAPTSAADVGTRMAEQGAVQGVLQGGGQLVQSGLKALGQAAYRGALRPAPTLADKYPGMIDQGLAERRIVGSMGAARTEGALARSSRDAASRAVSDAQSAGASLVPGQEINQPLARLRASAETASAATPRGAREMAQIDRRIANPPHVREVTQYEMRPQTQTSSLLDSSGKPITSTQMVRTEVGKSPLPMSLEETQALARELNRRADAAFGAARRGGPPANLEAEMNAAQATGATDALKARVPGLDAMNQTTRTRYGLTRALRKAAQRSSVLSNLVGGGVGLGTYAETRDPIKAMKTAILFKGLSSPTVLSSFGIGANELARLPYAQLVRAALLGQMEKTSHEPPR